MTKVVYQADWAAVKENNGRYDIWSWNVYKLKWTRMSNHGCGFGELKYAQDAAKKISDETQAMLDANRNLPPRL